MNASIFYSLMIVCLISTNNARDIDSLSIDSSLSPINKLSEIPLQFDYKIIGKPGKREIDKIEDIYFDEDRIIIGFREEPKANNNRYIGIYNESGLFFKNIPYKNDYFISDQRKKIYVISHRQILEYNFSGQLMDSIKLNHRPVNIVQKDQYLYYETTNSSFEEGTSVNQLHRFNLQLKKNNVIKSIKYKNERRKYAYLTAIGRLWIDNDKIFWAIGIENNLYQIQNSTIVKIPVDFDQSRNYMDQLQTNYGSIGDYLFCNFSLDFNQTVFLKNRLTKKTLLTSHKIEDDYFSTGEFYFMQSQKNNLFFSRLEKNLAKTHKNKFDLQPNNAIIFYSI